MFDSTCKFLVETFADDFATWLLGEPISLTQLSPSELSVEPIRADALILLQSDEVVLHIEFQTQPDPDLPFRMADYRLRVYRRFPQKTMRQVVIYLKETGSDLVRETFFTLERTRHEFEVIRLWEEPTERLLSSPGLLPLAVLSQTGVRSNVLQQVAQTIEQISPRRVQSNVAAATAILAGLVLEPEVIRRVLRRELMQESTIYREIWQEAKTEGKAEGIAEGKAEGIAEGKAEERQEVALNLLREGIAIETISRVTGLSLEQVQQLHQASATNLEN
ncbi:MAG: Rpn family recombination-promoting nuclease/putative transposase [Cyanosarcina radialis HA8281-LM2]|jgi:predicted transposase/invertase (TIGR01784 family)|nr:Rpn family recombination-promoting nuclease/putative transposase [Cyanosarcina radialis HA8281-LM2]